MEYSYNRDAEMKQVVSDWAKYTIERLQKQITKKKIGVTGSLNYSLLYKLAALSGGGVSSVNLEFNYYGKFIDMGVGRGQKIEDVKSNREVYNLVGGGRKPKKWFSRTLYAEVLELRNLMAKKYGEQGIQLVKDTIEDSLRNYGGVKETGISL